MILEMEDAARQIRKTLVCSISSQTTDNGLCPSTSWSHGNRRLGPQTVNHLNQFTSMTLFFNLKPGVALGDATDFITKAAAEVVPTGVRAELQGEAQTFANTVTSLTILMALGCVRDVRDPGDPV